MQKSPFRVLVSVLTMSLLGITLAKGYEAHQVTSAKALTSENWGLGFSEEGKTPTANQTPEELRQYGAYYIGNTGNTANSNYVMFDLENPYELYTKIQKTVLDIQTDIEFPNAYRPTENPGYTTNYKGPFEE